MIRVPRDIKSFDGIGWGQKASVRLAGGPMYHELTLITNAVASDILWVTLTVNGDVKFQVAGSDLVLLERYKKLWEETGRFLLPLSDISNNSLESQVISGLNTVPSDNILLEVQFGSGSGSLTLSASAEVSNASADAPVALYVPRTRKVNLKAGGSGIIVLDNVHMRADGMEHLRRVHFDGTNGASADYIDKLEIRRDKQIVFEQTTAEMRYKLKRLGRAPQAGYFHFDPIRSGFALAEMFSTGHVSELEFRITLNTSMSTIPALIESLEKVG